MCGNVGEGCTCEYKCLWRPEEKSEAVVRDICELPNVDTGSQTGFLCKNSKHGLPTSHLSNPGNEFCLLSCQADGQCNHPPRIKQM